MPRTPKSKTSNSKPTNSPINKALPKLGKLLARTSISPQERELILDSVEADPHRVATILRTSLQQNLQNRREEIFAKLDHPTPHLKNLCSAYRSSSDEMQKKHLLDLILIELKPIKTKTPLLAWESVILCAEAKVPPPPWAAAHFEQILNGYITGEIRDLSVVFGLKGTRGRNSEFCTNRLRLRDHELSKSVRFFCLQGATVSEACLQMANHIAKQRRTGSVNETIYQLIPSNFRPKAFSTTFAKKIYPRWLLEQQKNCTLDKIDSELKDQLLKMTTR